MFWMWGDQSRYLYEELTRPQLIEEKTKNWSTETHDRESILYLWNVCLHIQTIKALFRNLTNCSQFSQEHMNESWWRDLKVSMVVCCDKLSILVNKLSENSFFFSQISQCSSSGRNFFTPPFHYNICKICMICIEVLLQHSSWLSRNSQSRLNRY